MSKEQLFIYKLAADAVQIADIRRILTEYIGGYNDVKRGLCSHLIHERNVGLPCLFNLNLMQNACSNWEHFSGSVMYPIVGGCMGYNIHHTLGTLHVGKQGAMRVELCKRMLVELDKVTLLEY